MYRGQRLVQMGQAEVAKRNGDRSKRYYHGPLHTKMVLETAVKLARLAKCDDREVELIAIAAAWHDVVQDRGRDANEDESALLAAQAMRQAGYYEDEVISVVVMIIGTKIYFDKDGVMHQKAEESRDQLTKFLADADLCAIGSSGKDFAEMALRLMAEFAKKPLGQMTAEEIRKGWAGQVAFMTGRRFLTPEAELLFGGQMAKNLDYARRMAGM